MNDVSIVPFESSHLLKTFEWITDIEIKRLFLFSRQVSWENHLEWFKSYDKKTNAIFAIYYKDTYCGNCGIKNIVLNKEAELWIYIGDKSLWGKKIGTEATKKLLEIIVKQYNLAHVYLYVETTNNRAKQLYINMGFEDCNEYIEREFENEKVNVCKYILKLT